VRGVATLVRCATRSINPCAALEAKAIKVDLEQFKSIEQTAFVSAPPVGLKLIDGTWAGQLRAEGQVIRVLNTTSVRFKPTKREKKLAEQKRKSSEA
jgi:hypothetical protein